VTNNLREGSEVRRYRTIFLSDIHLGAKACQAEFLLDFLKHNDADTFYLVGDIIDFWRIKRAPHWPQQHNAVIQKLLRKARKGARLVYIPGNHDEDLRAYCGVSFDAVEFRHNDIHEAADGRRFLVMHGDEFDVVVRYVKWLATLGDWAYVAALNFNTVFNHTRRRLGMSYWSLSAYLKHKVKKAVNYIGDFESALASEARRRSAQGVICGHIHHAAIRDVDGTLYINTGDWMENCTAVAETHEGEFEIIHWVKVMEARRRRARRARLARLKAA
jgi:UDP-2,3-diacylglucosamine pyrophosphatase LpxH